MAPSDPSGDKPPSIPQPGRPTRVLTSKPIEPAPSDENSSGADFHKNFPEAKVGPATVSEAIKTIKPEDAFEVHKTVCGRQGFMTAIGTGTASGILRFVWKGAPRSAANWSVGGALIGAVVGFEYCQYLRRLERASMKRIVEVHTAATKGKVERKTKEELDKKIFENEAAHRRWWKLW